LGVLCSNDSARDGICFLQQAIGGVVWEDVATGLLFLVHCLQVEFVKPNGDEHSSHHNHKHKNLCVQFAHKNSHPIILVTLFSSTHSGRRRRMADALGESGHKRKLQF